MKDKATTWGVLTVTAIILLVLVALPAVHRPKARAQRITTVNSMSTVSLTMTNTSALPAVHR
jgi:hypothetical protein